jgi:hypothetical protein
VLSDAEIDFLKIDVQGAELKVLHGAPRLAATALVMEIEVEFVQLYQGQPLFADVDIYMRSQGFQLHALPHGTQYYYAPVIDHDQPLAGLNQLIWSDAIYIPNFETVAALPRARRLKMAALLHDFYGSWDLVLHILQIGLDRGDPAPFNAYAKRLGF